LAIAVESSAYWESLNSQFKAPQLREAGSLEHQGIDKYKLPRLQKLRHKAKGRWNMPD